MSGLTSIRVASSATAACASLTSISATWSVTSSSIPASTAISCAWARSKGAVGLEVAADQRVRVGLGHFLDVHAAHPREHREQLLRRAVEDDRGVVLGLDLGGLLDPEVVDGEAANVHPEDRLGAPGFGLVLGDLDPARLAALADRDLGLDHARVADLVRRRHGVLDRRRVAPVGDRDAVLGEQLLALVLE